MNTTPRNVRFAAAVASVAITCSLLSGVFAMAQPPVASSLLAQAAPSSSFVEPRPGARRKTAGHAE